MAMRLEEGGEKKTCVVCGSLMSRIIASQSSRDTRMAFQLVDVLDSNPLHPNIQPIGLNMLFKAFGCENQKCGHIEFFAYVAAPEITP